jgi:hypothetical protein
MKNMTLLAFAAPMKNMTLLAFAALCVVLPVRAEFDPELFKKTEALVMQDKEIQGITKQILDTEKAIADIQKQISFASVYNQALRTLTEGYNVPSELFAKYSMSVADLDAKRKSLSTEVTRLKKDRTLAIWQKMELIEPSLKPFISELRQTAAP